MENKHAPLSDKPNNTYTEDDKLKLEIRKLQVETDQLSKPFLKQPTSWLGIAALVLSLLGNLIQFSTAERSRQLAEIRKERLELDSLKLEDTNLKLHKAIEESGLALEKIKVNTQIYNAQLESIKSYIDSRKAVDDHLIKQVEKAKSSSTVITERIDEAINVNEIVKQLTTKYEHDGNYADEKIKALTEAVTALIKGRSTLGTKAQVDDAIKSLTQGDTTQAKALFEKAVKKGDQGYKEMAKSYRHLGGLAFLENTQEALSAYRRATEIDPSNVEGWIKLGLLLKRIGDLDEAIKVYNKALTLGEAHHDEEAVVLAYSNIGNIYQIRGDLDKAVNFQMKALKLSEGLGNQLGKAQVYSNLGTVFQIQGDYGKAVESFQKSLSLNEGLDNKEGMAQIYGNLGYIYANRGEFDKAEEYHQKALLLYEELGNKEGMAKVYGFLGLVYEIRTELPKAVELHQKALALNEALGNKEGIAYDYGNLGNVYKQQGHKEQAKQAYQKSIALFKALGNSEMVKQVQSGLKAL